METVSLQTLCEQITLTLAPGAPSKTFNDKGAHHYVATLKYHPRGTTLDGIEFHTGSGWKHDPKASDIMECLLSDASLGDNTFDDFCAELGYDTDSRKALESYLECQSMNAKLRRLLKQDFDTFMYAER